MNAPIVLETHLGYHLFIVMSRNVGKKKLKIVQNAANSTLAGMMLQLVHDEWNEITKFCSLELLRAVIEPQYDLTLQPYSFRYFCSDRTPSCL